MRRGTCWQTPICKAGHKVGKCLTKIETAVTLFKLGFLGSTDIQFDETSLRKKFKQLEY